MIRGEFLASGFQIADILEQQGDQITACVSFLFDWFIFRPYVCGVDDLHFHMESWQEAVPPGGGVDNSLEKLGGNR